MRELLQKAMRLIEAREKATQGKWLQRDAVIEDEGGGYIILDDELDDHDGEFIAFAGNNAVDIIKGYQDLLRRVAAIYRRGDIADEELGDYLKEVIDEAESSLPEELTHE
jgi:hypothetical protein